MTTYDNIHDCLKNLDIVNKHVCELPEECGEQVIDSLFVDTYGIYLINAMYYFYEVQAAISEKFHGHDMIGDHEDFRLMIIELLNKPNHEITYNQLWTKLVETRSAVYNVLKYFKSIRI